MTFYRQVGQNIKKYRLIKNYSLQVLAEKVGVTKKTMQRYETGDIRVDMNRLGEIAVALGVKVSALIYGTDQFIEIQGEVDLVLLPVVGRISCGNGSLANVFKITPKDTKRLELNVLATSFWWS
jgi:repressor LexA